MIDFLNSAWTWTFSTEPFRSIAISLLIAAVTALVARAFAARPRLSWGFTNQTHFLLPPDQHGANHFVRTANFTVSNGGRKTAENVEVVLNWRPPHIEYFPHIPIAETQNRDGRFVMSIGRLNPKELVNFSMLAYDGDLPSVTYVRCAGYPSKQVQMRPQRVFSPAINVLLGAIFLLGFFSLIFWPVYLFF